MQRSSLAPRSQRLALRRGIAVAFTAAALSVAANAQEQASTFAGSDTVTVHREGERSIRYTGRIQEILGESVILGRNNINKTEVFRLSDVTELTFVRPEAFDKGLLLRSTKNYDQAIKQFDVAIKNEHRPWAKNEMLAAAAGTCVTMGNYNAAVGRIQKIVETDLRSRHASLLPLVWDERLSSKESASAEIKDLRHASVVRRLVAASVLLADKDTQRAAEQTLSNLRKEAPPRIAELAVAQLWRIPLLTDSEDFSLKLPTWYRQLKQLPLEARGGPQHVIGRCLQRQHDYDRASIAFLWLPFMSPTDEALAARSMLEGIRCLRESGRIDEAETLRLELLRRFPKTSSATAIANHKLPTAADAKTE